MEETQRIEIRFVEHVDELAERSYRSQTEPTTEHVKTVRIPRVAVAK